MRLQRLLPRMRLDRIRWPEWVIGVGGLVLLAATLLLPWYSVTLSTPGPGPKYFISNTRDGWNGLQHAHWLILVTAALALATWFLQASRRAPAIPVTVSLFASMLGGLTALWLIYRVLINPAGGREIGGWIGLLSACAIAYGGYASVRLEGIASCDGPAEIPTVRLRSGPA